MLNEALIPPRLEQNIKTTYHKKRWNCIANSLKIYEFLMKICSFVDFLTQIDPKWPRSPFSEPKVDELFFKGTLLGSIWEPRKLSKREKKRSRNRLFLECCSEGARSSILAPMALPGPPNETKNRRFLIQNPIKS